MCSSSDQPTTVEITNFLCSEEVGLALKFPAPRPARPSWVGNRSLSFASLSAADSTLVGHHRFTNFFMAIWVFLGPLRGGSKVREPSQA